MKFLVVALLLCQALTVGTLFAFSSFVMPALNRLTPEEAIRAMQSMNETILRSPFMIVFGLSTLLAIALPIADRFGGERTWSPLLTGSCALYLVGVFGVTAAANVPLNEALQRAVSLDAGTWSRYFGPWTTWNHLRTIAGIMSIAGVICRLR